MADEPTDPEVSRERLAAFLKAGRPAPSGSEDDPGRTRAYSDSDDPAAPQSSDTEIPETDASDLLSHATRPPEELLDDPLLQGAELVSLGGRGFPTMGGVPLLAKLGQGGMGAVYYGIHPRLKDEVAVKVLPFHLAQRDTRAIRRFYREAQLAATVKSPYLVDIRDVNRDGRFHYLLMQYVKGRSAHDYLEAARNLGHKGLSEAEALEICIAATTGLSAAHAKGIIHRDIKPDNIMVPCTPDGKALCLSEAKLTDLGLASADSSAGTLTGTGATLGTPGFLPPEQALDMKEAGKSADVFSMGATAYALLSGHAPFRGDTPMNAVMATVHTDPPPIAEARPELGEATVTLINRCLEKDPKKRYVDAAALLEALKLCRHALSRSSGEKGAVLARMSELLDEKEVGLPVIRDPDVEAGEDAVAPSPSAGPNARRGKNWALLVGLAAVAVLAVGIAIPSLFPLDNSVPEGGKKPVSRDNGEDKPTAKSASDGSPIAEPKRALDPNEVAQAVKRRQEAEASALEWESFLTAVKKEAEQAGQRVKALASGTKGPAGDAGDLPKRSAAAKLNAERLGDALALLRQHPDVAAARRQRDRGEGSMAGSPTEAARAFVEATSVLQRLLERGRSVKRGLKDEAAVRSDLSDSLTKRSATFAVLYVPVQERLEAAGKHLKAGDAVASFSNAVSEARRRLDQADMLATERAAVESAQARVKGLEKSPDFSVPIRTAKGLWSEADLAGRKGDHEEARVKYRKAKDALEQAYKDAQAKIDDWLNQAREQARRRRPKEALETLARVEQIDPSNHVAKLLKPEYESEFRYQRHLEAAKEAEGRKDWPRAAHAYLKAFKEKEDSVVAKLGYEVAKARIREQIGRRDQEALYAKAMADGRTARTAGRLGAAEEAFLRALTIKDKDPLALAELEKVRGQLAAARSVKEHAERIREARNLAKEGNWRGALVAFTKAEQLKRGDKEALQGIAEARVGLARKLEAEGDRLKGLKQYKEALGAYLEARKYQPNNKALKEKADAVRNRIKQPSERRPREPEF